MDYEEEFHAIEAIMEEASEHIARQSHIPNRILAAESQLARMPESKQREVALATGLPLEILRGVLGQSFGLPAMQHVAKLQTAAQAFYAPPQQRPPVSSLAGLRSTAEKIRAYSAARSQILDELARDDHGLSEGYIIVEPER